VDSVRYVAGDSVLVVRLNVHLGWRVVRALLFAPIALLLTLVSLPWLLVSIGAAFAGDAELSDAVYRATPAIRFLDWMLAWR
jgi:hypothetical protein